MCAARGSDPNLARAHWAIFGTGRNNSAEGCVRAAEKMRTVQLPAAPEFGSSHLAFFDD